MITHCIKSVRVYANDLQILDGWLHGVKTHIILFSFVGTTNKRRSGSTKGKQIHTRLHYLIVVESLLNGFDVTDITLAAMIWNKLTNAVKSYRIVINQRILQPVGVYFWNSQSVRQKKNVSVFTTSCRKISLLFIVCLCFFFCSNSWFWSGHFRNFMIYILMLRHSDIPTFLIAIIVCSFNFIPWFSELNSNDFLNYFHR